MQLWWLLLLFCLKNSYYHLKRTRSFRGCQVTSYEYSKTFHGDCALSKKRSTFLYFHPIFYYIRFVELLTVKCLKIHDFELMNSVWFLYFVPIFLYLIYLIFLKLFSITFRDRGKQEVTFQEFFLCVFTFFYNFLCQTLSISSMTKKLKLRKFRNLPMLSRM